MNRYKYDYIESQRIARLDYGFYALLMAAMRQADDMNKALLKEAFPDVYSELRERYNAPGGLLEGEQQ